MDLYKHILRYNQRIDTVFFKRLITGERYECISVSTKTYFESESGELKIDPEILEVRVHFLLDDDEYDTFYFSSATDKLISHDIISTPLLKEFYDKVINDDRLTVWFFVQMLLEQIFLHDDTDIKPLKEESPPVKYYYTDFDLKNLKHKGIGK